MDNLADAVSLAETADAKGFYLFKFADELRPYFAGPIIMTIWRPSPVAAIGGDLNRQAFALQMPRGGRFISRARSS
ncbi:MAG: hypothetical protein QNJ20_02950 [Paracoccaceae bacterium]|nr:hypothetical protein [Paracoccaceae bacterium]